MGYWGSLCISLAPRFVLAMTVTALAVRVVPSWCRHPCCLRALAWRRLGRRMRMLRSSSNRTHVLVEGLHLFALDMPPFWEVSVDSKEASSAVAVRPLEGEEDSNAEEEISQAGKM